MEYQSRQRVSIIVTGRVQGVGFRYSARQKAIEMNLTGFVRNLPDGSVSIEAEGRIEDVERFLQWCHNGPPRAIIRSVDYSFQPALGYENFGIR